MKNEYKIILILILIILFLLYTKKKEHLFVGSEPIINLAKVYADASGTSTFNNIGANTLLINNKSDIFGKTTLNGITTLNGKSIINNKLDVSGVATINGNLDVSGNTLMGKNIMLKKNLLFQTDETTNQWEGIHTFWMQTGSNAHQRAFIKNPDGETYNADKWVCLLLLNYDFLNEHGLRTYVDTITNDWCIYKWAKVTAYVTVMCYPRQMFTKVWTTKEIHKNVDSINASPSYNNTLLEYN